MSSNIYLLFQAATSTDFSDIGCSIISVTNNNILENTNEELRKYLCDCRIATSVDAIVMCLKLGIRHSLDWCTIIDCFEMINMLSARKIIPRSKFKLFKLFTDEFKSLKYHIHILSQM